MAWQIPIYDRTLADATTARQNQSSASNLKGALNVSDLNRIEGNIEYLKSVLDTYGYHTTIITHSEWNVNDLFYLTDMDRIRQNVINLVDAYYSYTTTPTIELGNYYLDVTDINDVEKVLYDINEILNLMINSFKPSGTFVSGQSTILPRRI